MTDQATVVDPNQAAANILNALQAGRTNDPKDHSHDLSLLTPDQAKSWMEKGYFILRGVGVLGMDSEMPIGPRRELRERLGDSLTPQHLSAVQEQRKY